MKASSSKSISGFTMVELMIGVAMAMVLGGVAYAILTTATTLMAKNLSLNSSSTTLRKSLDRVFSEVTQANGLPTLFNPDGSASSPAAGIIFDRYLGGPYVVLNPSGNGLLSTATSFQLKVSTDGVAYSPAPRADDVVLIDDKTTRPLVQSCSPSALSKNSGLQTLTVQLQAKIGTDIKWDSSVQKTAYLIHREALVVIPAGSRAELRFYKNAETLTTSTYNNVASYTVLTRDIGTKNGEMTPFSIVTQGSTPFLNVALRVEDSQFNNYLTSRLNTTSTAKDFNSFLRVDTKLRPRNFL